MIQNWKFQRGDIFFTRFDNAIGRYVDVRLERKKEVLDAYHSAVEKAAPEKPKEAEPKKGKRAAKKKHSEIDL